MGPEGIRQTIQTGKDIITIETGRLAKQADGAAVVTCGKTMLLATVVAAKEAKDALFEATIGNDGPGAA